MANSRVERIVALASTVVEGLDNRQNMVALIIKGGKILSVGCNDMERTHPSFYNGYFDKGIHAEYDAIRNMKHVRGYGSKDVKVAKCCDLYILRFKKSGEFGDSKPCEDCYKIIQKSGISRLYYYSNNVLIKENIKTGD